MSFCQPRRCFLPMPTITHLLWYCLGPIACRDPHHTTPVHGAQHRTGPHPMYAPLPHHAATTYGDSAPPANTGGNPRDCPGKPDRENAPRIRHCPGIASGDRHAAIRPHRPPNAAAGLLLLAPNRAGKLRTWNIPTNRGEPYGDSSSQPPPRSTDRHRTQGMYHPRKPCNRRVYAPKRKSNDRPPLPVRQGWAIGRVAIVPQ